MTRFRSVIRPIYRFKYGCFQTLDQLFGRALISKTFRASRQKLYQDLIAELAGSPEGEIRSIDRVENLSFKEFKKQYLKKGIPVIFSGVAKEWGGVRHWSLDYFKDLHGEDEIVISGDNPSEAAFEILKLKDLIDNIKEGGSKYYRFYPLLSRHPEHIRDFDHKWLRTMRNMKTVGEYFQVFIGGKGTYTPLHNSTGCNLFTQMYGEKKFVLIHPKDTMVIDPDPGKNLHRSAPYRSSTGPFNPFKPNFDQPFELYKFIDRYEAHLKPGDVLFNPPHYWHAVENLTDSIGVGYRWWNPIYSIQVSALYSILDLFIINPPFWKLRKMFKTDYNILHLMETGVYDDYVKHKK